MTKREKEIFVCAYNGAIDRARTIVRVNVDNMDPKRTLEDLADSHFGLLEEKIYFQDIDWPACETEGCCRLLGHEFNDIPHGPYDPKMEEL